MMTPEIFFMTVTVVVGSIEVFRRVLRNSLQKMKLEDERSRSNPTIPSEETRRAEQRLQQLIALIPEDWTDVRERLRGIVSVQLPALVERKIQLDYAILNLEQLVYRYEKAAPAEYPKPKEPLPITKQKYEYDGREYTSRRAAYERYDKHLARHAEKAAVLTAYLGSYAHTQLLATKEIVGRLQDHRTRTTEEIKGCIIFLDHFEAVIHSRKFLTGGEEDIQQALADMAARAAEQARREIVIRDEISEIQKRHPNVIPLLQAAKK